MNTTPQLYLAKAPKFWGVGATPTDAVRELRKGGYTGRTTGGKIQIFIAPIGVANLCCDVLGWIEWTWIKGVSMDLRKAHGRWIPYRGRKTEGNPEVT